MNLKIIKKKINFHKLLPTLSKFIVIGIISTILNYTSFFIFYKYFKIYYLLSSTLGFILGLVIGFYFNKQWTFEYKGNNKNIFIKYLTLYLISLIISQIFLYTLVSYLYIIPLIGNIFCICISTAINFIGLRMYIFRNA